MSNTINWGKIHGLSYSPETNLTGTAAAPSFTNTKSIELDGVDDFVDCGTTLESWIESANKSFSAWVKNDGNTANSRIFNAAYTDAGSSTGFALGLTKTTSNKPYYFFRQSNGSLLYEEFGDVLNTTDWYHFAISIDGTANEAYIYQNGVLKVTVANVGNPAQVSVQTAKIGKHWDSTINQYFDGYVDELALFNTTLTSSNVTDIYNSGVPASLTTYSPFLWYRCGDGDTSPTLTDNGSGGNNGTMTNFSTFSTDVPT